MTRETAGSHTVKHPHFLAEKPRVLYCIWNSCKVIGQFEVFIILLRMELRFVSVVNLIKAKQEERQIHTLHTSVTIA